jgi:hypothetical protein
MDAEDKRKVYGKKNLQLSIERYTSCLKELMTSMLFSKSNTILPTIYYVFLVNTAKLLLI